MSSIPFSISRAQVRELDRRCIDELRVPDVVLMENAGRGVSKILRTLNPTRDPVIILTGPGNNGGDGFVIARHLDFHGWPVIILPFEQESVGELNIGHTVAGMAERLPPAARANFEIVRLAKIGQLTSRCASANDFRKTLINTGPKAWILDALFGTGLSRPVQAPLDEVIEVANRSGHSILAVDVPSGLDTDTGEPLGPTIRAHHTATFVAHKKGFGNPASRAWTGEIHVVGIGAPRMLVEQYRQQNSPTT